MERGGQQKRKEGREEEEKKILINIRSDITEVDPLPEVEVIWAENLFGS